MKSLGGKEIDNFFPSDENLIRQNVKFYIAIENQFLQKLIPCSTRQIGFVSFEKRPTIYRGKIFKNQCFYGYADMSMMYINFPMYCHFQEFIKETGVGTVINSALMPTWLVKKVKE